MAIAKKPAAKMATRERSPSRVAGHRPVRAVPDARSPGGIFWLNLVVRERVACPTN